MELIALIDLMCLQWKLSNGGSSSLSIMLQVLSIVLYQQCSIYTYYGPLKSQVLFTLSISTPKLSITMYSCAYTFVYIVILYAQ